MNGSLPSWCAVWCALGCLGYAGAASVLRAEPPEARIVAFDALNVELAQPSGCEWRKLDQGVPAGLHAFGCSDGPKQLALVLMVDDHDYRDTGDASYFASVRGGLERGAKRLNGVLASFRYEVVDFNPELYRVTAEYKLPAGSRFMHAYAVRYDRAYFVQMMTASSTEPPALADVAKSLTLLRPASPKPTSSMERRINAVEAVLVGGAFLYLWYRRKQKVESLGLKEGTEGAAAVDKGPGVHM
ncbi:MAG: hypothetical protein JW940_25365 [Polyangiaceae bacterium]|nr:hypothetical protein [Polyangiaceae bacterium]